MRPTLKLVCVLHFHQPTGVSPAALERAFDSYYELLLDELEATPQLRVNLHFTGTILEHALARRPAFLDRLRRLWKDDRIELLGGAFHDPVLSSIPERDAIGQLQYTANFYNKHLGRLPQGAWLCLRAWDPSLTRILARSGARYTLLDDAQFVLAGLHPDEVAGHYITERAGHPMSVFAIDAALVRAVAERDPARLVEAFDAIGWKGASNPQPEVFAGNGEELMRSGRLTDLLTVLKREYHWVHTLLLESAWANNPSRGRVYLPTSSQPELGDWCRPAAAVSRRRDFAREMSAMGVWEQAQQFVGGVVWDNFLVKYPEANRIHKRMLRVSNRIDTLRNLIAKGQRAGKKLEGPRQVLEKACSALWRSQNHSVYWHGGPMNPGVYNAGLRQRTLRELLMAEQAVDRILYGKQPKKWMSAVGDLDADGLDEVMFRTAHLSGIVHPGRGGSLGELDLRDLHIALESSLSPVEEPYHQRIVGNEVALVADADHESSTLPLIPGGGATVEPALANLTLDRVPRASFQDHFLGAETTLDTFARRHFRELGDFATEPYEIVKVSEPNGTDYGRITVGRSGVVKDLERSQLLRIEKTFQFDVRRPRMVVTHELQNRSREAAGVWFGLEWTFGIPSADPEQVSLMVVRPDESEAKHRLSDGPVDLGEAAWLEWEDAGAGLAIVIELGRPMTVWLTPVTTVHLEPTGLFQETTQGNTLLLHAPVEIWGEEQQQLQVRVDFVPTKG